MTRARSKCVRDVEVLRGAGTHRSVERSVIYTARRPPARPPARGAPLSSIAVKRSRTGPPVSLSLSHRSHRLPPRPALRPKNAGAPACRTRPVVKLYERYLFDEAAARPAGDDVAASGPNNDKPYR